MPSDSLTGVSRPLGFRVSSGSDVGPSVWDGEAASYLPTPPHASSSHSLVQAGMAPITGHLAFVGLPRARLKRTEAAGPFTCLTEILQSTGQSLLVSSQLPLGKMAPFQWTKFPSLPWS